MSKKILVLTPRLPYPTIGGDKLRIYRICKDLRDAGCELTLLSLVANNNEARSATSHEMSSIFKEVVAVKLPMWKSYLRVFLGLVSSSPLQINYYRSRQMQVLVNSKLKTGKFDSVLVHLVRMAPYVIDKPNIKKVIEMTDAISLNYKRSREHGSRGIMGKIYRIEEQKVKKYEEVCVEKFDATVVVSPEDRAWLLKSNPIAERKIKLIPLGISDDFLNFVPQNNYNQDLIIFIGNMRTYQNDDAIRYFIKEIFPLVKVARPEAKLRVIGASPSRFICSLNGKNNIEITRKVADVKASAAAACVSICPMRIGAGIQTKILESMALGIPVVATKEAAKGIVGAKSGEHYFVADTREEFADDVIQIMQNKELRNKTSCLGKEFINYWSKNLPDYSALL